MDDDSEVRITLRLPAKLRDRLSASADANSRSMNGEIVERLDWSLDRATDEIANLTQQLLDAEDQISKVSRENSNLQFELRTAQTERQALERLLNDALAKLEGHTAEWREHVDVLRWVNQQLRATTTLLEYVAANDGTLPSEMLPLLLDLLGTQGQNTGFPNASLENLEQRLGRRRKKQ